MILRPRTIAACFLLVAGIIGIIVVSRLLVSPYDADDVLTLPIGRSRLDLEAGEYQIWFETVAHPDERTEFSDFSIAAFDDDGKMINVSPPDQRQGRIGRDSNYVIFTVAQFSINDDTVVDFDIEVVGAIERGELIVFR